MYSWTMISLICPNVSRFLTFINTMPFGTIVLKGNYLIVDLVTENKMGCLPQAEKVENLSMKAGWELIVRGGLGSTPVILLTPPIKLSFCTMGLAITILTGGNIPSRWPSGTVPDLRSWVRLPPVAAVYQRQLSMPSLRGLLMSSRPSLRATSWRPSAAD